MRTLANMINFMALWLSAHWIVDSFAGPQSDLARILTIVAIAIVAGIPKTIADHRDGIEV